MSKRRITVTATAASLLAAGALVGSAISPAHADIAPQKNDVVGVGSDVVQNAIDFLADGYTGADGTYVAGYNETKAAKKWRLFNFDASGDAAGTSTTNATAVLQAGGNPYNRPNGGGSGLNALIADGSNGTDAGRIDFARNPSEPTAAQEATAVANLGSKIKGLDWVTIATDTDYIATTKETHAPSFLTPAEVFAIYHGDVKTWSELASYRTTSETGLPAYAPDASWSSNKIIPFYPQNGAGMQTQFFNGLKSAHGGTAPAVADVPNGIQVKQNDPTTLIDPSKLGSVSWNGSTVTFKASDKDDVIVPLPQSKYNLFSDGYFLDGSKTYSAADGSQSPVSVADVQLLKGTGAFQQVINFNIIFRDSDLTSKTAWQPGSKLNWVQTLFYSTNPYASPDYKPTKKQAKKHPKVATPFAFTPAYQKLLTQIGLTPVPYAQAFHLYSTAK